MFNSICNSVLFGRSIVFNGVQKIKEALGLNKREVQICELPLRIRINQVHLGNMDKSVLNRKEIEEAYEEEEIDEKMRDLGLSLVG